MPSAVAYLTEDPNPDVSFRFRLGDRVVSTLDTAMAGVIVWGDPATHRVADPTRTSTRLSSRTAAIFSPRTRRSSYLRTPHTESGICSLDMLMLL